MIAARSSRRIVPFILGITLFALFTPAARAGLIHRYSFTDPTPKDSVGSVDATLKGSAKIADGKLVLDNADKTSGDSNLAYLEFSSSVLPKGTTVSLVIWFTVKEAGSFPRLLDLGDKDGATGQAFIYFTPHTADDNSRIAISATDTASKTNIDGARLDDGKAHMAAIVIDGDAKKLHIFIDGKEPVASKDLGDNTLDKVRATHSWIGRSAFDQDAMLSGSIDEFCVYDNALTLDQAADLSKAGPHAAITP